MKVSTAGTLATFDGQGDLIITRNPNAIEFYFGQNATAQTNVCRWQIWHPRSKTRIGRFLNVLPAVWRHLK